MKRILLAMLLSSVASYAFAGEYAFDFSGRGDPLALDGAAIRREALPAMSLPELSEGDELHLRFTVYSTYDVKIEKTLPSFGGAKSFSGRDESGAVFATVVRLTDSCLLEVRDIPNDRLYRAAFHDDSTIVETIDLAARPGRGCIQIEAPELEDETQYGEETPVKRTLLGAVPGNPFDNNVVAPAPVTVDIMVVFDNGAREWVEQSAKYSSITNFAIAQVTKMNQVLGNTGIDNAFWYRLVDVMTVDTRMNAIDNNILTTIKESADSGIGAWGEVKTRRDACGADLVATLIKIDDAHRYAAKVITGIGHVTHGTSYNTWVNTFREWCYSASDIISVDEEYTLSHEVGHNMGLSHSPTLEGWSRPGTFDYSNGYNFWGNDSKPYHTIMAYNTDKNYTGYKEIPYFSTPNYTYQGVLLGTALSNDCTRALSQTCVGIADWRATKIPLPSDVVFTPVANNAFIQPLTVSLSTLGGYEIRYTLDGSEPTSESPVYNDPLTFSNTTTIKAIAIVDENTVGAIASAEYTPAVATDTYLKLTGTPSIWSNGNWTDETGGAIDKNTFNWSSAGDKTAFVLASGNVMVDKDVSMGTLVLANEDPLTLTPAYTFSASTLDVIGNATLTGTVASFENWKLHPNSTLTLAPGANKSYTYNKNLALSDSSSTFVISNGTVEATVAGSQIGCFGTAALRIAKGGTLVIGGNGWKTGFGTSTPLTIETDGLMKINSTESLHRTLVLNGGAVDINCQGSGGRALDFNGLTINVTDDSTIKASNANGVIVIRGSSTPITIAENKTLSFGAKIASGNNLGLTSEGMGIVKKGLGTLKFTKEPLYTGATAIDAGMLEVGFTSTSTNGTGWTVASGATLKIDGNCKLDVPVLNLTTGSKLILPAAISAPLAVSNSVDLAGVEIALTGATDLAYGKEYPLLVASDGFSGISRIVGDDMPALEDGLAWKFKSIDGTLYAIVSTELEVHPVSFQTNVDTLEMNIPEDVGFVTGGGIEIDASPILINGGSTSAFSMLVDLEVPETAQNKQTVLCSWNAGSFVIYCVRKSDATLDCYWVDELAHSNNIYTDSVVVDPGRHTLGIGYSAYGGTIVFLDGQPAYFASGLRWSTQTTERVAVGAIAGEPTSDVNTGLKVYNIKLWDTTQTSAMPFMTSNATMSYNYIVNATYNNVLLSAPPIVPLSMDGGCVLDESVYETSFSGYHAKFSMSVMAAFPDDAAGTIFGAWTRNVSGAAGSITIQAEYDGKGTFYIRDDGNSLDSNPAVQENSPQTNVSEPHLYTMTFTLGEGVSLYQDGVKILSAGNRFKQDTHNNHGVYYRATFGSGPWHAWRGQSAYNPMPMPELKIYASHIALDTDDPEVSENAVKLLMGIEDEPETPIEPESRLPVVDVLVAFDNGAQAYVANKSQKLEEFAEAQIQKMNDVLVTNKLDRFYSYRLAGTCKVDANYPTVESVSTNLVSGAGPLVTLRAARELCGADTVTLLVKASGGATLGDSIPLSHSTDVASRHDCAFSVCSISAVDTGAQHTMIHENAHNMGCGHARQQSAINSPFEYGRGFYFMDGTTKRHTIMAYDVDGTGVYAYPSPYFSTTSKEFGFALGDTTNDNARVLKETCGEVAKWRESVVPGEDDVRAFDENGNEILSDCFFNGSLKVTVEAPVEGAELYYTFDGSEPVVDDEAWHQTSPFKFNFTVNRTLKIAYKSGETLSPVRTIRFTETDNVPTNGLWQTCLKYPWKIEGDAIRSFNQTDYTYQCTTPLKATVVGPKRLSFSHKSYFGGATLGGANYSHFDVLVDDSPVFTQTECTTEWEAAAIDIPAGTHDVVFVFSQRYAMNNPSDNKDATPKADDAVWLKDIALVDLQTVECAHSSTSDDVDWVFPYDYEATAIDGNLGGIEVVTKGVVETLGFDSTNAVVLSVLAELPEGEKGEIAGCKIVQPAQAWTAGGTFHAFAYSNGDGTFSLGYGTKTNHVTSTADKVSNWTGLHVWTFAFAAQGGAKLYCDGELLISADNIQWSGSSIADTVTYGDDPRGGWVLTGAKVYAVHSDFGDSDDVFDTVSSSVDSVLSSFGCLAEYADESQATKFALLRIYKDTGSVIGEAASECVLRISEIMPKPTDDRTLNGREGMDVNGLESGWVEVENTSDQWADLKDYRFIRVNRGKKTDPAGVGNFPSRLVPPRGRAIFYTSERYSNSKDQAVSAFAEGTFNGKPMAFVDYGNILVWGDKVNPKKSPYVRLYYAPGGDSDNGTVVDTVVVPSDLPEGWSIIVGNAEEGEGTRRWMCPTPTRGTANTKTDGLTRIGPNVGPLYEKKGQKKTDFANEFAVPTPPAVPGTDYTVTLPINGVMNPDGSFTPRAADQIQSIKFVYRKDLDDATLVTNDINMATKTTVENWGDQYTATIPASDFPAAGHLMQWKVLITDGEGVEWTSPSFNNPDDGYEWYGTIVEADTATQMSATLPTWHMFADSESLEQMDVDASDQTLANNARVAIYDSSTSNYYDYVRIDLRGNTSKNFTKKSHGLRFAKSHPLTMTDVVTGEPIEEIRKTSLISEFADPSYMRQMIAFWLWKKMGNLVPFDFPVRCNMNGEFYQLAFNSERFTDELIEDVYGLDKFGYSYKNVGTMNLATTTAGSIEKKTPDDEDESNISVLTNSLVKPLQLNGANVAHSTSESASLTKFVVKKFDLPAWLNYLASARITQEMDDVWANVCAYYDNPDMLGGVRGKDTWMPLGYDFNLTFGQYYINDLDSNALAGLSATNDWYKSHPLYGGWTIRARKSPSGSSMNGNNGFEAIYQSAKFRRLYLRRLRTLMDQELKEPGTPEGDTPFMSKMREMANLMRADAILDLDKWKDDTTDNAIDVWKNTTRPADMDAGINDIWDNYVVPRREHLYVTHSVTNTARVVGYGSNLNAGIPEAQSPIATLAPNISISNLTALDAEQAEALGVAGQFYGTEVVIIQNDNAEAVDMSGWRLAYSVDFTFPAGTVCDANDAIHIVADRRAYIDAHEAELTDQVIVGNATFTGAGPIALYAADGTLVYSAIPQTNELKYLRLHSFYGNTLDGGDAGEWFTLTNISDAVTLDLADVTVCFLKQGDDHDTTDHCHVTLTNKKGKGSIAPLKSWTASQADYSDKGWLKIQNSKQQITIYDKYGSVCQSLKVEQKKFLLAYGNGGYLVCDSTDASVTKNSQWHAALYELANDGEQSEPFSAEDQEVANELVATAKPVLSEEDIAAGLNEQFLQYLMIVAEPVEGSSGQYKAVVVVNPETVEVPVVGVDESASAEPVEIEDDEGGKTVSVSITNAIIGLWYGYEVSDALGESAAFGNDVDSFNRATNVMHTVKGSLRSQDSGFFRVKVLPAKPVDP